MPTIVYFAHDLTHPDVPRRVRLLQDGGAEVSLIGFQRRAQVDQDCANTVASLGVTVDADFKQRLAAIIGAIPKLISIRSTISRGDTIVARNLEMLLLASIARFFFLSGKPLVYECLDIHRLMVSENIVGRLLRIVERVLLSLCAEIVTSSPAFEREYFRKRYSRLPPILLIENKVYPPVGGGRQFRAAADRTRPWRIGWFGVIRCRASLDLLTQIATQFPGLIEVVIAGRPARGVISKPDLEGRPGIRYLGEFDTEEQLGEIIRSTDFTWAIDFYESDANSLWLLPNRLYRSTYYGVPAIAMDYVETGRWLQARGIGLVLDRFETQTIAAALADITSDQYEQLAAKVRTVSTAEVLTESEECRSIVQSWVQPGETR